MQAQPAKTTSTTEVQLRSLSTQNLDAVAVIHVAAQPEDTITLLGLETVRRYYEWQMIGPHSASAFGAFFRENCVGFFFGGVFRGSTSGFLRENRLYLSLRLLTHPWLIRRASFRNHLRFAVRLIWNSARRQTPSFAKPAPPQSFGILALNVSPSFQRKGIGKLLMQQAEEVARKNSFYGMHLTIPVENENALAFLQHLGWEKSPAEGEWRGQLTKTLQ